MNNEFHEVTATYQTHTEHALCVQIDITYYWFPLISIKHKVMLSDFNRGDDIEFEAQAWILIQNNLEWMIEE